MTYYNYFIQTTGNSITGQRHRVVAETPEGRRFEHFYVSIVFSPWRKVPAEMWRLVSRVRKVRPDPTKRPQGLWVETPPRAGSRYAKTQENYNGTRYN